MQIVNQNGGEYAVNSPTRCILNLARPPPENYYLVIQITKIYKGEALDSHLEIYTKANIKNKQKLISENNESIKRLTPYRQIMAWGAIPIGQGTQSLSIPLTRTPKGSDLMDYLDEISKKTRLKPLGTASFELRLMSNDEEPEGRFDTSFRPVIPFPEGVTDFIPEIQLLKDLPSKPHKSYVNNLHLFIGFTTISNSKSKSKFSEIIVEAKLLNDDTNPDSTGLPVVYDPWNTGKFSTIGSTSVFMKKSRANEEIKIQIPFQILPTHNIVFTVYAVQGYLRIWSMIFLLQ